MNTGAPRDSWSARAPMILARSNLVNVGGPVTIWPFLPVISVGSCSKFLVIILRFLIISHSLSISAISFSVRSTLSPSRTFLNNSIAFSTTASSSGLISFSSIELD